jgi:outer membrane protein assembly factor BamA
VLKPTRNIFVVCLAVRGLCYGQDQTRADQIQAERTQKETTLTPETAPKAQLKLQWIESSPYYRLFTGNLNGFGLGFGTILPGSGFALRPSYERPDLFDGKLVLKVEALGALNQSYEGGFHLSMPNLFDGFGFWDFGVVHRDISEMPYYGSGPDSRKTGRSDYRLEDTNVDFRPGVRIHKGLRANLIGSYLAVNVGRGHSDDYISAEQQYGPSVAPGINHQTDFWRGGGKLEYDWRDDTSTPTSGGRYYAQYLRYLDQNSLGYSFYRLDLDASQFIPLVNHTHVIALHAASSLTDTNAGQHVPFYLQPTLGGPETLRGFRFDRFYGNNSTLATAEYRWELSPTIGMVAFFDGGKVFNQWEQWNFHDIQTDVGFGIRFKDPSSSRTTFSFDTGFSHEGFQIWFRVNSAFESRTD